MRRAALLLLPLLLLGACAAKSTYITIVQTDTVYENGRPKFQVHPGEMLQILGEETCPRGSGTCWVVRSVKTDEVGFVSVEVMRARHRIEKRPTIAPPKPHDAEATRSR